MTTLVKKTPQVSNEFFKTLMRAKVRDEFCDKANDDFRFTLKDVEKAIPVLAWPNRGSVSPSIQDDPGVYYLVAEFADETHKMMSRVQGAMLIVTEEQETIYTAEQWERATFKYDRLIRVRHERTGYDVVIYAGTKRISVGCQTHPLEWWAGDQGRDYINNIYNYNWDEARRREIRADILALQDGWEKLEKKLAAD